MTMPTLSDYTRVRNGDVLVEYASPDSENQPGAFASVGCLEGDFNVSRATEAVETDITNWCTIGQGAEALAAASPGDTTIQISGTLVMILSDEGYRQARDDAENRITGFWRITASDGNVAPEQIVDTYRGFYTQFDDQHRQDQTSVNPFTVRVTERIIES